jgi:hypothetical protein
MVDEKSSVHPELIESVDKGKRRVVQALLTGIAFAAPLMASFEKDGLKFTSTATAGKKKAKKKAKKRKKKASK